MSYLSCKQLLLDLMELANTGENRFAPGIIRDGLGHPMLHLATWGAVSVEATRSLTLVLLGLFARPDGVGTVIAAINSLGAAHFTGFRDFADDSLTTFVPVAQTGTDVPYAVLLLASATVTPQGDALTNRVALCENCKRFFLRRKRRVPQRHCSARCYQHQWRQKHKKGTV